MSALTSPIRVQMHRTKGWRKPDGVIYVGRPSLWGNPWRPGDAGWRVAREDRAAWAVDRYRRELARFSLLSDWAMHVSEKTWDAVSRRITELGVSSMAEAVPHFLAGRDLACWCPLDRPCHADVLLDLANPA